MQPVLSQPAKSQTAATQQPSGMPCPVCQGFIPISIYQLLHDGAVTCPHCGLSLTVNRSHSQPAMDALKKVEGAISRVREAEKFKL